MFPQEQFNNIFDARNGWKRGTTAQNGSVLSEEEVKINDIVLVTAQVARYVSKDDCTGAPRSIREWGGLPWRVTFDLLKIELIARGNPVVEEVIVPEEEEEEI